MQYQQKSADDQLTINSKSAKSQPSCMELVIKHIRHQRCTCASLFKEINLYSSSSISRCLKKLKDTGMIGAVWDSRKVAYVYFNNKL